MTSPPPAFDPEATVQLDPEATVRLALPPTAPAAIEFAEERAVEVAPAPDADGADRRSSVEAVARGGGVNLFGAGITTVANLLLSVVVARAMSQANAGIFFSITSLILLLSTIGRVGTGGGAIYFLPRLRLLGSPQEVAECLRLSVRSTLAVSSVLGLGMLLLAPQIAEHVLGNTSSGVVLVLRLCGLALPFAALGDVLQSITRGFGRMRTTVLIERIARPLAQLVLVVLVVLVVPTHSVLLLVLAWTVPYLPATLLSWLPARRMAALNRARRSDAAPSGFDRREYWRFTGPRALISLTQVGLQRADVLLIISILGPVPAALYSAATRFLVVGQLGNQAISVALQPRLSAALARKDLDEAGMLYRTTTSWLVLTTWPLYLLVGAFPAGLLSIFGHRYASATDVVVVLCGAMLVATASGQVDTVLMMAGKSTWNLAKAVLALVVQVGVDLILIPQIGILGAAIGWAVSILVANLVPLAQLLVATGLHPVGRSSVTAVVLCTATVLPPAVIARVAFGDRLVPALAASVVAALLWAGALWKFRRALVLDAFIGGRRRGPRGGPGGPGGPGSGGPGPGPAPVGPAPAGAGANGAAPARNGTAVDGGRNGTKVAAPPRLTTPRKPAPTGRGRHRA
ncbi:MAG TPA: polysaccharide biosynthesis C-terminal domain-containing protein [Mycobacteriales bacterium]|nr:polysaccharide biosynthesis C-terminal domain-containing protein [Mycobacteriales bacterium]